MTNKTKRTKNRHWLYILSGVTVGCIAGSFAYPLQKIRVYHQPELDAFKQPYNKVFIRTENDTNLPYGFDEKRAKEVAAINQDAKLIKIILLASGLVSAATVMVMGDDIVDNLEIENSVKNVEIKGRKQLAEQDVKNRFAMASEAKKQMFRQELKELVNLCGGDDTQDATENDEDKLSNVFWMTQEGHTVDFAIQQQYGLKPDNPEFNNVKTKYLEEYSE